jgi:hypothetical protein
MAKSWDCPFCNRIATVNDENITSNTIQFDDGNKHGVLYLNIESITCPNPECREYAITAELNKRILVNNTYCNGQLLSAWQLRPESNARPFPDFIPAPLLADYAEACMIRDLSPKASATLSRRCLHSRRSMPLKKKSIRRSGRRLTRFEASATLVRTWRKISIW